MKIIMIMLVVLVLFLARCGNDNSATSNQSRTDESSLSYEGKSTLEAINEGKKCTAIWSSESSKAGQDTEVYDVREMDGKTQYRVFHSPENGRIWTWDFRIYNIQCR